MMKFKRLILPVILGSLVFLIFTWHFMHWNFSVDDAYISFRYADHFAQGEGLVYNPGEKVEGFSNFLWVLILATFSWLGAPTPITASILGFFFGLLTLAGIYWGCHRILELDRILAFVPVLALTWVGSWVFWAGSGLEGPLFTALLTWSWVTYALINSKTTFLWGFSLMLLLLSFTRPEGILLSGVLLAGALFIKKRNSFKDLYSLLLPMGVGWILLVLFRIVYYGELLPNTFYAKISPSWWVLVRGFEYLKEAMWTDHLFYIVPFMLIGFVAKRYQSKVRMVLLLILAYLTFILVSGGDGLYKNRFIVHIVPLFILLLGAAIGVMKSLILRHRFFFSILVIWMCLVLLTPTFDHNFYKGRTLEQFKEVEKRWERVGLFLDQYGSPQLYIATNVAGRLPFYSKRKTLDMLGLCNAIIARTPVEGMGRGYAGHEKGNPDYVISQNPDIIYISVLDQMPFHLFSNPSIVMKHLMKTPLFRYAGLMSSKEFNQNYQPAQILIHRNQWANIFISSKNPHRQFPSDMIRLNRWN